VVKEVIEAPQSSTFTLVLYFRLPLFFMVTAECEKSSLNNQDGFVIASEMTAIAISVDITKGFAVTAVYEVLYESIPGGALVEVFDNLQLTGTAMLIFTRRGLTRGGTRMLESSSIGIGGAAQKFEFSSSSFAFTAFMIVVGMVGSFPVV
jgi:hypothetical protein